MNPLTLTNTRSGATARILPEAGFTCFSLRIPVGNGIVDVLDSEPDFGSTGIKPTRNGIPLLFPFPNRIRGRRFIWEGKEYDLSATHHDGKGNAIHGLVVDRPWRVVEQDVHLAVGRFRLSVDAPDRRSAWPADFQIDVQYTLHDQGLRCDVRISNLDTVPLPWGFGTHPYFRVPLSPTSRRSECLIQAPVSEEWELNDSLPTGRRHPVSGLLDLREGQALGDATLDNVLTGLASEAGRVTSVVMDPQAGLSVTQVTDAIFRELVVFTPPSGRAVCLEPYTCMTDAVHLAAQGIDAGWRVLAPGAEFRTWFEIHVGMVYA